jgi:predicted transposase YbfD/YdcC
MILPESTPSWRRIDKADTLAQSFAAQFATLEGPRLQRTQRHKLLDVVFIAICATVSGANDFVGMEKFGKSKRLVRQVPQPGARRAVARHLRLGLRRTGPCELGGVLSAVGGSPSEEDGGRLVAIDGKAARATLDRAKGRNALHGVSALNVANHLPLGQEVVDAKSNEITAIPKLLEVLAFDGAIVTIDAPGCQKEIAAKIRERGADYVLAVKGNQEHLEEDIGAAIARLDEGQTRPEFVSRYEATNEGHGRTENRRVDSLAIPRNLRHLEEWKDARSICRVTRVYQEKGTEMAEVRYFMSSVTLDANLLAAAVRNHRGIENGLHWCLDMYFSEDRSRARTENAPANLALLRRRVLSLLRRDKAVASSPRREWDSKRSKRAGSGSGTAAIGAATSLNDIQLSPASRSASAPFADASR